MNMIGLVRNEWKKVFLPVLLTTVLLAIAMSVLSCTIYQNYTLSIDDNGKSSCSGNVTLNNSSYSTDLTMELIQVDTGKVMKT